MFKVFISDSIYQGIITSEENKTLSEKSYLYKLLKKQPIQVLKPEDEVNIKANPKEVLNNPSSLYILSTSAEEASAIENSYGVMCLSGDNPDISPLIDVEDYFKPSKKEKKFKGWDRVLDTVENLPSNALVLRDRYLFKYKGKNSRLDELHAAVLDVKLKYLEADNAHRQEVAKMYYDGIKNPLISLPKRLPDVQNVYHLFPILCTKRDKLQAYLKENGVETLIHYPIPPHKQECYAGAAWNKDLQLPITEQIAAQELSLPIGPTIQPEDVAYIIDVINRF